MVQWVTAWQLGHVGDRLHAMYKEMLKKAQGMETPHDGHAGGSA